MKTLYIKPARLGPIIPGAFLGHQCTSYPIDFQLYTLHKVGVMTLMLFHSTLKKCLILMYLTLFQDTLILALLKLFYFQDHPLGLFHHSLRCCLEEHLTSFSKFEMYWLIVLSEIAACFFFMLQANHFVRSLCLFKKPWHQSVPGKLFLN